MPRGAKSQSFDTTNFFVSLNNCYPDHYSEFVKKKETKVPSEVIFSFCPMNVYILKVIIFYVYLPVKIRLSIIIC